MLLLKIQFWWEHIHCVKSFVENTLPRETSADITFLSKEFFWKYLFRKVMLWETFPGNSNIDNICSGKRFVMNALNRAPPRTHFFGKRTDENILLWWEISSYYFYEKKFYWWTLSSRERFTENPFIGDRLILKTFFLDTKKSVKNVFSWKET